MKLPASLLKAHASRSMLVERCKTCQLPARLLAIVTQVHATKEVSQPALLIWLKGEGHVISNRSYYNHFHRGHGEIEGSCSNPRPRNAASQELAAENQDLRENLAQIQKRLSLIEQIDSVVVDPPKWTRVPTKKGALYSGTPTLFLSDLHLDEVVKPQEVEGYNAFNRDIAIIRLRRTLDKLILVTRQYYSGLKYEGVVIFGGGDIFSGNIKRADSNERGHRFSALSTTGRTRWQPSSKARLTSSAMSDFAGVVGNHWAQHPQAPSKAPRPG